MGWFTNLMEDIDRPSNALQGLAVDGLEGFQRGWKHKENYDFEQMWDEDLQKKGWSVRDGKGETASNIGSTALNVLLDPLNAIPFSMIGKGIKGASKAKKAGASVEKGTMRGMLASSVPNFIQGRYVKTARTVEVANKMKAGLLSDTMKFTTPFQQQLIYQADDVLRQPSSIALYTGAKRVGGHIKTGAKGIENYVKTLVNPEARALYRSEGINKKMLTDETMLSHKADKEIELVHRAFYNAHILEQSGKVGGKQLLKDFSSLLGVHGYQPYIKGSYHKLSKGYGGGVKEATKSEHKYIEKHIGSVWKDKGVPFNEAKNTKIFIKRGHGGKGGAHYNDVLMRNQSFSDIAKILGDSKPISKLNKSKKDASEIFGKGAERVRYTDPKSGGTIEVVSKKDGTASVLELVVPEKFRGKGIGKLLQKQVINDFPNMGGQVSSKAAAKTAYDLGRRPPNKPNATLDDVFKIIDSQSSVNLVIKKSSKPKNLEELKKILDNGEYTSAKTKPTYTIDEKTGNVWAQFKDSGSSITEANTNVLLGIKPSGKFVMTISDEHNFLEAVPLLGRFMSKLLPNRVLAVTPPMVDDFRKFKHQQMGVDKVDGSIPFRLNKPQSYSEQVSDALSRDKQFKWGKQLDTLRKAEATPQDLAYEMARQSSGAGMLGLNFGLLGNTSSDSYSQ